jgi:hypothetical protein
MARRLRGTIVKKADKGAKTKQRVLVLQGEGDHETDLGQLAAGFDPVL